jgi:ribosomal peptide maturation radical SAM protein 1
MAYRRKSAERFRWEVEEMTRRYGARYFFLADNILPMEYHHHLPQWTRADGVHFFYEIKANVKRRHMESMAGAGITAVQPGIEHFSSKVLQQMRKGVTGIQNIALLKYARECGVMATYNILTAFPDEDRNEYALLVAQLPKLIHLRPPSAMAQVEYHRFSPYHSNPDSFGLRLRPAEHYSDLYPFGREVIERLAYFFESDAAPVDLRYLKPLYQQIVAWARAYDEDRCSLVWRHAGEHVEIEDQRPGFGPKQHRLSGDAAALWKQLEEPQGLASLARAGDWSADWVRDQSEAWDRDGLVYIEKPADAMSTFPNGATMYLGLAVREPRRPVEKGWLNLGL